MICNRLFGLTAAIALLSLAACDNADGGTAPRGQQDRDASAHEDAGSVDMNEMDASMAGDGDGDGDDDGGPAGDGDGDGDGGTPGDGGHDESMDAGDEPDAQVDAAADDSGSEEPDASDEDAGSDASTDAPLLPALAAHYPFDENASAVAADAVGTFANAELKNGAGWTDGVHGSALSLAGGPGGEEHQYAALPVDILETCDDITVALWMKLGAVTFWSRLLEIDGLVDGFVYFTPSQDVGGKPHLYFNVFHPNVTGDDNQGVSAPYPAETTLVDEWHHVAFTLTAGTGRLYFDGVEIGSNPMATKPSDISFTDGAHAWIGRSMFPTDAYLNAAVDDLRISCTAYTAAQIAKLAE